MHNSAIAKMRLAVERYMSPAQKCKVLDVGSRVVREGHRTHREIFTGYSIDYIGIDVAAGPNVDVVMAEPYTFPLESNSFDIIVSGQVFEHVPYFWATMLEMARTLKHGGHIFLTAPSRGHVHSPPYDCWRFYADGYRALSKFANLELLECTTDFPPVIAETGRFDYAKVAPNLYWGDTFGVFKKGPDHNETELNGVRAALLPWVNKLPALKPLKR